MWWIKQKFLQISLKANSFLYIKGSVALTCGQTIPHLTHKTPQKTHRLVVWWMELRTLGFTVNPPPKCLQMDYICLIFYPLFYNTFKKKLSSKF